MFVHKLSALLFQEKQDISKYLAEIRELFVIIDWYIQ